MTIAEQLADALNADPRTLAELTAATGIDGAVLSRLARGLNEPRLGTAERVAAGLGYELRMVKAPRGRAAKKGER